MAKSDNNGVYNPPDELADNSNVMQWMRENGFQTEQDMRTWCDQNYLAFWDERAKTLVDWVEPYSKILNDDDAPFYKWFEGGKINIAYNALDRHAKSWRRNKLAYIFVGEPVGDVRKITYYELYREVNKLANGLKSLGIKKGDKVGLYMPMIPELPISMLACAKIGAVHVGIFSGFSPSAVSERLNGSECKLLITCDGSYRRGKPVMLKPQADEALKSAPSVEKVIVCKRNDTDIPWSEGTDVWWDDLVKEQSAECETEAMDPEDRLFILYTAGTAGGPKGIEHVHGGYCVGAAYSCNWVFDLKEDDVFWSTADIGWITGITYNAYGPLILGATSVMYEGSPDYPDFGRWFQIIEEYGVSVLYTAPTAIRMFMKEGPEWPEKFNLSSVRLMGSVGEAMNPDAFIWWRKYVGSGQAPIMDTWFSSETGSHIIAPLPITPLKPGSPSFTLPGYKAGVFDDDGKPVNPGESGNVVIAAPWPSMFRGVYKEPERYKADSWEYYKEKNIYLAGDKARLDEDGYVWITGRIDDVLNVAGHRLSNSDIEQACMGHEAVKDAAVIGKPDPVKAEAPVAFVILNEGVEGNMDLKKAIRTLVRTTLSPIAMPADIQFVDDLPKDKAGTVVRDVIKAKSLGQDLGDTSKVANPEAIENIPLIVEK